MREAPAYVLAHDLAREVVDVAAHAPGHPLAGPVVAVALDVLAAVSTALTFPRERVASLRAADASLLRLRVSLRVGADAGVNRVLRGGSAWDDPDRCRSAYRNRNHPRRRDDNIGFRVCFPAPNPPFPGAPGPDEQADLQRPRARPGPPFW